MKQLLRSEELAMFGASLFAFSSTSFAWWWFLVLILAPDIGMIGYLKGPRAGAFSYNLFHHKGIAVLLYLGGIYAAMPWLELAGIILFGHASMDRILGYGLKYSKGFDHTHLGRIKGD